MQSIQVTVNDLPRVGNVLDKIVQAGVSQIDYIANVNIAYLYL